MYRPCGTLTTDFFRHREIQVAGKSTMEDDICQETEVYANLSYRDNEELNDLYSLPNIVRVVKSRRMRWAGHVARMVENRGVYRVLVRKPEGKRPLGRPRRRWEDNIKMDLREVGGGRGDWMELAQDRDGWRSLVGTVRNLRVP